MSYVPVTIEDFYFVKEIPGLVKTVKEIRQNTIKDPEVTLKLYFGTSKMDFCRVCTTVNNSTGEGREKGKDSLKVGIPRLGPFTVILRTAGWQERLEKEILRLLSLVTKKPMARYVESEF